jgi:hypothetical protein
LFLSVCFLTLVSGVIAYGLGSNPEAVLGILPTRGVKLQLVLPLFATVILLLDRFEWEALMNM